jgi:Transposase DDE domain
MENEHGPCALADDEVALPMAGLGSGVDNLRPFMDGGSARTPAFVTAREITPKLFGLLVSAVDVVQAPNDKQQLAPMLGKIGALPEGLGDPETLLADTGYFSAANVETCEKAGIEPLIAMGRQPHRLPLAEHFEQAPPAPENPTPVEAMAHRLKTPEGRKVYALRKQTPEPVFGIIK